MPKSQIINNKKSKSIMEENKGMDEFIKKRTCQVVEELKALVSDRQDREVSFFLVVNDKDAYSISWHALEISHLVRMFGNILQDEYFVSIATSVDVENEIKKISE